jgi:hypothetical protein
MEKFLEIIEKMDKKEKRKAFSILSQEMQKQVIGYINVFDDIYEPAISESETFCPRPSFGITNTFICDRFIPFPEGKNLFEMTQDPLEFHKWCENNLK